MSPPERAIVLCVDEKCQVQALDRTQTLLPMTPGTGERPTHDYVRNGTTSLFAALNMAIGQCHRRHRRQEFLKFLNELDAKVVREPSVAIYQETPSLWASLVMPRGCSSGPPPVKRRPVDGNRR